MIAGRHAQNFPEGAITDQKQKVELGKMTVVKGTYHKVVCQAQIINRERPRKSPNDPIIVPRNAATPTTPREYLGKHNKEGRIGPGGKE